jgi:hypothetical protein
MPILIESAMGISVSGRSQTAMGYVSLVWIRRATDSGMEYRHMDFFLPS